MRVTREIGACRAQVACRAGPTDQHVRRVSPQPPPRWSSTRCSVTLVFPCHLRSIETTAAGGRRRVTRWRVASARAPFLSEGMWCVGRRVGGGCPRPLGAPRPRPRAGDARRRAHGAWPGFSPTGGARQATQGPPPARERKRAVGRETGAARGLCGCVQLGPHEADKGGG